jgi:lipoprotein-releasing system ATP-binding protein
MENRTILEASGIVKSYREGGKELKVLCGANLSLGRGEIACLMGESGSGKTTLLNILGSLDKPDQGKIIYNGRDIADLSGAALSRFRNSSIGFLFQFHYLLADFTALENAIMPGLVAGRDRKGLEERARGLFERVGIAERAGHAPSELSGGEQQRVAMVRALMNDPVVVLADEPTGNLDEGNSAKLLDLLFELGRDLNKAFLIATHSRKLAGRCDRVFYLEKGKVGPQNEL